MTNVKQVILKCLLEVEDSCKKDCNICSNSVSELCYKCRDFKMLDCCGEKSPNCYKVVKM